MTLTPHAQPLSAEDAAHFLRRTAFGATEAQIRALVGQDARAVAKAALNFDQTLAANNPFDPTNGATPGAMLQLNRAAWLYELLYGPHPLRERLALTWSNHFVVGTDKVRNYPSLRDYLALLRRRAATTDFTAFTGEVARTAAMLRYLDNDQNRKGRSNENFSRELLELFTTGIGHYTEKDVAEGARALSGWTLTGGRGNQNFLEEPKVAFLPRQHDAGRKTYLGQSGDLGTDEVIGLATRHPATATFIARKLHRAFVSDAPGEQAVAGSAATFTRTGGNVRAVLEELLSSAAFYASRHSIIRSPVEFVAAAVRSAGQPKLTEKQVLNLAGTAANMGQTLLQPDTVEGWKGGRSWVNDSVLLTRMQVAASLTTAQSAPAWPAPSALALLGSEQAPAAGPSKNQNLNEKQRTYLMLVSPEFQLA